jgi:hypothetical protein
MRMYDARVCRFISVDPISKKYPELTPYQFASNRPIQAIDLDGLEAYLSNSGDFVKWGPDKTQSAPVILLQDKKEIQVGLNVQQFQNRVYWITGEGGTKNGIASAYYAHTIKNAKEYGYHGEGFSEEKLYSAIWKGGGYNYKDFLAGLPDEKKTNNFQSYKNAYTKKDDFAKWDADMKFNAKEIMLAETNLSEDPTRGATNWGGGEAAFNWAVGKFGVDNVIKIIEKGTHVFYNYNTGKLKPSKEYKLEKECKNQY